MAVTPGQRWLAIRYAVPTGRPDRRDCEECGRPLRFPLPTRPWSPVGRCAACGTRTGPPPYVVELLTLGVLLLAGWLAFTGPVLPAAAFAWWALWAVPLVLIDLAVHRLPDRLTYPAALGAWLLLGGGMLAGDGRPADWLRAGGAGLLVAALFAASTLLLGRRGFGLGDAKLALGTGVLLGWVGWPAVLFGLLVAVTVSGLSALFLLVARRVRWASELAFGPFLVLGTAVAWLLAG
ncbi:prepilin peptidase [Plantactinospora sp. GCM10030261]|uniref:prepilin peptidase n=1 Tax=Plantactinospora sp. GCM10030261 TaxID=3273420 RepID=UPI00360B3DE5